MGLASELQAVMDEARGWRTGKPSGGGAFSALTRMWRSMDMLMLTTKLRVAVNTLKETPGYELPSGKDRPGMRELESGAKHLAVAISEINKGMKKMSVTTFLEDWDEDGDGLGMDDEIKRKKPTDVKDVEKEVAKKAAAAAPPPAAGEAPPEEAPPEDEGPGEDEPEDEVDPPSVDDVTEARLLDRIRLIEESL